MQHFTLSKLTDVQMYQTKYLTYASAKIGDPQ